VGILENEVALFDANSRAKQERMRALEAQRARAGDEISSLRESISLHDEEVRILEEELGVITNLVQRGVSPQSKLNDLRRELGRVRREALEFRTELFRAEQARLLTEQEIANIDLTSDTEKLAKLSEVELEMNRASLKLERAQKVVGSLRAATTASQKALGRKMHYTLFRLVGDNYQLGVRVNEFTKLTRGDVIRVTVDDMQVRGESDIAQAHSGLTTEGTGREGQEER
jgi:polysaccharide export outer membrane protein